LFTGDTLGYSNRVDTLTGFPRYGNNRALQAQTLRLIKELDWALVAPGHGHIKEYGAKKELRNAAIDDAIRELVKIR
jgi:glyoxylase-like metal-dependent hydrolase (beta-lactamase superfamily II)